jgi:hypothetical protein
VSKYEFTPEMGEISGFGGGYEDACRSMLKAAMEWFDANPNANPEFKGCENVYGLVVEDNDDAKALSDAAVKAAGEHGCTGAMHQAVITHSLFIKKNGWDKYVEEMSKREQTGAEAK